MREIKFRGFCKEKNSWVYGMLSKIPKYGETFIYVIVDVLRDEKDGEFNGLIFLNDEVEEESIGQFTGKLDLNKKEIYDNDIILFQKFSNYEDDERHLAKVIFEESSFCWEIIKEGRQSNFHYSSKIDFLSNTCSTHGLEIIGNIYENPELLQISE